MYFNLNFKTYEDCRKFLIDVLCEKFDFDYCDEIDDGLFRLSYCGGDANSYCEEDFDCWEDWVDYTDEIADETYNKIDYACDFIANNYNINFRWSQDDDMDYCNDIYISDIE